MADVAAKVDPADRKAAVGVKDADPRVADLKGAGPIEDGRKEGDQSSAAPTIAMPIQAVVQVAAHQGAVVLVATRSIRSSASAMPASRCAAVC